MSPGLRDAVVGEPARALPAVDSILAVCAHPDDESFGLGAVLDGFAAAGARLAVLSFTHGEASTLHGTDGDLAIVRAAELEAAGKVLGVAVTKLLDYADGSLASLPIERLASDAAAIASDVGASALLVFDHGGITGHPDHQRATDAALLAAGELDLPVIAWTVPATVAASLNSEFGTTFAGRERCEVDIVVRVDRTRQRAAIACHTSQATENAVLWRRLELLGDEEWLRTLRPE